MPDFQLPGWFEAVAKALLASAPALLRMLHAKPPRRDRRRVRVSYFRGWGIERLRLDVASDDQR